MILIRSLLVALALLAAPSLSRAQDPTIAHVMAVIGERDTQYKQRFEAQEKAVAAALAAAKEAVEKAESAANKRYDLFNEFRTSLSDQSKASPTRVEVDARLKPLEEKLASLELRQNSALNRSQGASDLWGYILGGLGLMCLLLGAFLALRRPAPPG